MVALISANTPNPPADRTDHDLRLQYYAYQCAMCGYDGALLRNPAGLQAAHLRWHSQGGPDDLRNGIALCAIHHVLLDLGVLGLTRELKILVSPRYVARTTAGKAVDALAGRPLSEPRPSVVPLDLRHVDWHKSQVFKGDVPARQRRSV